MEELIIDVNGNISVAYEEKYYKSIVQEVEENYFLINLPVEDGVYLTLGEGDKIDLIYFSDFGYFYKFESEVISRVIENDMPMYKMTKPEVAERVQRRNYVRVSLTEYAVYKKQNSKELHWQEGMLLDLSGGGLRLKVKEKIQSGEKIAINIYFESDSMEMVGKILRCTKSEVGEYICAIEFVDIDERKRDKIVQKVFSVMRKQRELM